MSMCPAEERHQREEEGGLSVFEATEATASLPFRERVADPDRTVKIYRRSAAGRDMCRCAWRVVNHILPTELPHTNPKQRVPKIMCAVCVGYYYVPICSLIQ